MRFFIICAFIFQHGFGLPTKDTQPVKAKNCIKMSPEKEKEINTLLEEVTDSLNNIALKHDNIDITVLKIDIESHSDDESDEKETKLHVLINDCHDNECASNAKAVSGAIINKCDKNNETVSDKGESGEKRTGEAENGDVHEEINENGERKDRMKEGERTKGTDTALKETIKDESKENVEKNNVETAVIKKQTANENPDLANVVKSKNEVKSKQHHDPDYGNIKNDNQSQMQEYSDIDKTTIYVNENLNDYTIQNNGNHKNIQEHYRRQSFSNAGDKGNLDFMNNRRKLERPHDEFSDNLNARALRAKPRRHGMKRPELMILHLDRKGEQLLEILQKRRRMYPLLVYVEEREGHNQYVFL